MITAMNIIKDPETGFFNSCHAATQIVGAREGLSVFATPHSVAIMDKYRAMGATRMPIAFVFGLHPAYEVMANFSGLHMDSWGELEMVGTIMERDVEVTACETIDLSVPAHAEIVVEGWVSLNDWRDVGSATAPTMYALPQRDRLPLVEVTAITMRADRPIYRNHQTVPDTDHQSLPRLCHEAVLYNRLSEMGLDVQDVRFPPWGGALSCLIQFSYPRDGFVNDALMLTMGSPWLNTKMVVALSPDTNLDDPGDVYHAIATRCDPARDFIVVPGTRGSPYDPAGDPIPGQAFWRTVGKVGIDATIKSRHDLKDFDRAWPKNWGKVNLSDYLT
jgi:UbiD family decarboxylase